jgi:transposase, IS5 family
MTPSSKTGKTDRATAIMSWKNLAQTSLSDALVKHHQALEELDGIHQLIDWKLIEQQMSGVHAKKQGEQAWPPLLMFKALLLQSWYGLSDPGLEKQLARDLMFRRFINLGLSEGVPDHSTIWRFRNTLTKQGLLDTLLAEVNRQLSAKGLYIKAGEVSIVDATVIEAKQSRPRKGKDEGEHPRQRSRLQRQGCHQRQEDMHLRVQGACQRG